jgi:hypothetical protein
MGMVRLPDEVVKLKGLRKTKDVEGNPLQLRRFELLYDFLKWIMFAKLSLHLPVVIPGES